MNLSVLDISTFSSWMRITIIISFCSTNTLCQTSVDGQVIALFKTPVFEVLCCGFGVLHKCSTLSLGMSPSRYTSLPPSFTSPFSCQDFFFVLRTDTMLYHPPRHLPVLSFTIAKKSISVLPHAYALCARALGWREERPGSKSKKKCTGEFRLLLPFYE